MEKKLVVISFALFSCMSVMSCSDSESKVVPKKPCETDNTFSHGSISWSVTTFTRDQRCEGYVLSIESGATKYRLTHNCTGVVANMQTLPGIYSIGLVACGAYTSGAACTITINGPNGKQVIQTRIGTMNDVTL